MILVGVENETLLVKLIHPMKFVSNIKYWEYYTNRSWTRSLFMKKFNIKFKNEYDQFSWTVFKKAIFYTCFILSIKNRQVLKCTAWNCTNRVKIVFINDENHKTSIYDILDYWINKMPLFIVLTLNFLKLSVLNLPVVFSCLRYGIYFELGLIKAPEYVYNCKTLTILYCLSEKCLYLSYFMMSCCLTSLKLVWLTRTTVNIMKMRFYLKWCLDSHLEQCSCEKLSVTVTSNKLIWW